MDRRPCTWPSCSPSPRASWPWQPGVSGATRDEPTDEAMAVSENRGARYQPYIWLVYLAALFVQPAFDPSAGVLDWLAVAVLIAVFLPLYRIALGTGDQRRLIMLIAAA